MFTPSLEEIDDVSGDKLGSCWNRVVGWLMGRVLGRAPADSVEPVVNNGCPNEIGDDDVSTADTVVVDGLTATDIKEEEEGGGECS